MGQKKKTAFRWPHVGKFSTTQLRVLRSHRHAVCSHDTCGILITN